MFGGGGGEEELSGRCAAILANGKRCPNASLPGSRFCGVAAHQALEGTGSDRVGGEPEPEEEPEETEEPQADEPIAESVPAEEEASAPLD